MFRSRKQTPVSENKYRNPWITLSIDEKRKCHEKFEQYKPSGSTIITKHELQKMLKEIGRDASEEELLEMLQRGDPKGEGFITYQAFERMVEKEKTRHYEEVTSLMGLTFDAVAQEQKRKNMGSANSESISFDFFKYYLKENFGLSFNPKILASSQTPTKSITRDEFMKLFS